MFLEFISDESSLHFTEKKRSGYITKDLRTNWQFPYTGNTFKKLIGDFIKKYILLAICHRSVTYNDNKTYPSPQQASFHYQRITMPAKYEQNIPSIFQLCHTLLCFVHNGNCLAWCIVLMFSPACCHSGAKWEEWICIILSKVHYNDTVWHILLYIPPDPDYFVQLAFKLHYLVFDSSCQLPQCKWLTVIVMGKFSKYRLDRGVKNGNISFLIAH